MGQTRDPTTGQLFDDGAANVRPFPGPQTQSRNRNLIDIAETHPGTSATNTATWTTAENITELMILATADNTATTSTISPQSIWVAATFNASSDAAALANLDLTIDSATTDVQWFKIPLGVPKVFQFTAPVTRADFASVDAVGAGVLDVWIGAH